MDFKTLIIEWYSAYGVYNIEEIDVEGLDIFAIAQKINIFHKKAGVKIERVKLQ